MVLESSPRLTQCTRSARFARSGSASSLMAITVMSMPWLRAPSSTKNGKRPFPAISPQPFLESLALIPEKIACLFHNPAFGCLDEFHQFTHIFRTGKLRAHLRKRLSSIHLGTRQQPERSLQRLDPLRRKTLAFQSNRVRSE